MAIEITWLGHSTVHVELQSGEVILIDPWLENPAYPEGHELKRVDLMLITHGHFDHIGQAVDVAKKFSPQVVANFEIAQWLSSKGVEKVTGMNKGGSVDVLGCRVTMTHAQHSSSIDDDGTTIYGGEAAGFVVKTPNGRTFYHAGDTNVFSDMSLIQRLYRPTLAMLPIGDLYTMDPREAALACEFLQPKQVLPLHWGTFPALIGDPEQLAELVDEAGLQVDILSATTGEPFDW